MGVIPRTISLFGFCGPRRKGLTGTPTGLRRGSDGPHAKTVDSVGPKKGRLFLVSPTTYIYRGALSGGAHPPDRQSALSNFPVEWASTTVDVGFGRESLTGSTPERSVPRTPWNPKRGDCSWYHLQCILIGGTSPEEPTPRSAEILPSLNGLQPSAAWWAPVCAAL